MAAMIRALPLAALLLAACGAESTRSAPVTTDVVAPTTEAPPTTASTLPATTVPPATSSSAVAATETTSVDEQGMCGDLVAVVTDEGTTCVDPDAPALSTTSPTTMPTPTGDGELPALLVADGTALRRYELRDDDTVFVVEMGETRWPATALQQAGDGTVFTEEPDGVVRYGVDGSRSVVEGASALYDLATIAGVESVVVASGGVDGFSFPGVVALAVDDLRQVTDLGLGAEAEFGVTEFDWNEAAGLGVASAWADLTEWIGFVDAAGDPVDLPSPTDDLVYAAPPFVTSAAISLDGRLLYWAEGPDWEHDRIVPAPWVLRAADLQTGQDVGSWVLTEPVTADDGDPYVGSVVDLGGRVLVNRTVSTASGNVALPPLILDLAGPEPDLYEFPAVGVATPLRSLVGI